MSIRFTQHARHKFDLLRRHGFEITQEQVEDTLTDPEVIISQPVNILRRNVSLNATFYEWSTARREKIR